MATVEISTLLKAPAGLVSEHILTSRLLLHICAGMLSFRPIDPPEFPQRWSEGEYHATMLLGGLIPLGRQTIGFEGPTIDGEQWSVRDNGRGTLVKRWDHYIVITPRGENAHYTDRVVVEAGLLTPVITLFAMALYRYRQRRLRKLAKAKFDYSSSGW